ncbi:MAG: hypothetical protein A3B99_05120 [Candidatus Yanofskybacteria bacterium RIFCSPHIGHO2_02_FULL_44_12b]|uniref:Uncharacterized protein n=2 Tax=Candidatus Yanofskyibacteriota TaxID=1752733 RepID=A0A1F8GKW4_9BACT|nr:MAG: hypothetical protein UW79_C0023G0019 [Candidatus Yanofskybacteria bacterium GW2011_GWA2_44_9]OGN04261.1 MAG: hypothetical protein A2659_03175 [Candidatus Yanofskybacteria bacterium RIFCSPHIGHO2_01_FULL_44_24]OGN14367.1 MAG: hypothetical protein A3B99_05120 [Candidatus Yanofskybacteria bacterium RIFCSPHIGHO2_02_FULL_44_12b]OGN25368.1 MAG: hypothetical protein A2925_00685 [Candidatus Yanofskybacteria bacterium RIFCSPLOWO2_01_FULL_44_22]
MEKESKIIPFPDRRDIHPRPLQGGKKGELYKFPGKEEGTENTSEGRPDMSGNFVVQNEAGADEKELYKAKMQSLKMLERIKGQANIEEVVLKKGEWGNLDLYVKIKKSGGSLTVHTTLQ